MRADLGIINGVRNVVGIGKWNRKTPTVDFPKMGGIKKLCGNSNSDGLFKITAEGKFWKSHAYGLATQTGIGNRNLELRTLERTDLK